jgi:5-methyltetrahydrofolate--homocysteine methyltransferase
MSRFLETLRSGRVLLMDGAMGTELQRAGLKDGECGEHWNLTNPDPVRAIHQAYQSAGAECFLTNTFQSNPWVLMRHGLESQLEAINQLGLELARSAAGPDGFVIGDIGPIGDIPLASARRVVRSLALSDVLLFETCADVPFGLMVTSKLSRPAEFADKPILLSLAFFRDPKKGPLTYDDLTPQICAQEVEEVRSRGLDLAGLGANCGRDIGMDEIIQIIRAYRQETDLPLFARPNAGTPTRMGDRWIYPRTPEQMAERLPELLEAGVNMIGGCCGTTPEHIAAFRPIVEKWNAQRTPRHQSRDR